MSLLTHIDDQKARRTASCPTLFWLKPHVQTVRGANLSTAIASCPEGVISFPLGVSSRFTQRLAAWKPGIDTPRETEKKVRVHYVLVTTYTHKHTEEVHIPTLTHLCSTYQ